MRCSRLVLGAAVVLLALAQRDVAAQAACNENFMDALKGFDTFFMQQAIQLSGYADKLPSPSISITLLVPTNGAWMRFLFKNGFGLLGSLSDVGDKLTSIMTYHIIPSPQSPDALGGPEGTVPTVFGLLEGSNGSLKRWVQDSQFLFQGQLGSDTIAGVGSYQQVCNSWIYIVDEVLMPADSVSNVPVVQIPDLSAIFGGGSTPSPSTPSGEPAPVVPPVVPSAPAPEAGGTGRTPSAPGPAAPPPCGTSFAAAIADNSQLGILKTVLGQPAFANLLPDPSLPYTLFAPVDSAFFGLLSTFNISITDALGLGGQLTAVLLYHVAQGSYDPDQLKTQDTLSTALAAATNNGAFTVKLNSNYGDGKTTVAGNYPDNVANLQSDFAVCASHIYIVDKVLIPAGSLDQIPSVEGVTYPSGPALPAEPAAPAPILAPSPSPAPGPAAPSGPRTAVEGVALASGHLTGCTVTLRSSTLTQSATTDGDGRFSISCGGECDQLQDAMLMVPTQGQPSGCADTETKMGVPFELSAPLAPLPTGASLAAVSPLTTLAATPPAAAASQQQPVAAASTAVRKLLQQPALSAAPAPDAAAGGGSAGVDAQAFYGIMQSQLGLADGTISLFSDPLQGTLNKDIAAFKVFTATHEVLCSMAVGGASLAGLAGSSSGQPAVAALYQQLLPLLQQESAQNSLLNLTSPETVASLLTASLGQLQQQQPAAGGSNSAATAGRRLLQQAGAASQPDLTSGLLGMLPGLGLTELAGAAAQEAADLLGVSPIPEAVPSVGASPPTVAVAAPAPAAPADQASVINAVAEAIATINSFLEQTYVSGSASQLANPGAVVEVLGRIAKVAQTTVVPAAVRLAVGALSLSDFQAQFTVDSLTQNISSERL